MNLLVIKNRINDYLNRGDERNIIAKKNIIASFVIKMVGIVISLIMVPMTINYVWFIVDYQFYCYMDKLF